MDNVPDSTMAKNAVIPQMKSSFAIDFEVENKDTNDKNTLNSSEVTIFVNNIDFDINSAEPFKNLKIDFGRFKALKLKLHK